MSWSDDDPKLRVMWEEGKPAATIAAALGRTKNSVIGRVHRLELTARPSPIKYVADQNRPARPKISRGGRPRNPSTSSTLTSGALKVPEAPPPPALPPVRMKACCWPMWPHSARPPRPATYCDAPVPIGSAVYCESHTAKARS